MPWGYLFLSGLESVAKRLNNLEELRLLIGNTSNRETVEMLAEGCRRLDLAAEEVERQVYPKRTAAGKMAQETADNLRNAVELMDQTDEAEAIVAGLMRMIEEKRLKVRVYTKGRLHAKAYICDYGDVFDDAGKKVDRHEKGIAGFLDVFSGTGTISFIEKTQPEYLFRTLLPQCVSIMARLP